VSTVEVEALAHPALGVVDLPVHLDRRQVDEPGRQVGDQRLELETSAEVLG
jgi:hypothetical protein